MTRLTRVILLALVLAGVAYSPLYGVKTRFRTDDTEGEFASGKMENVIHSASGGLRLGYTKTSLINDAIDVVTSFAVGKDGTVYIGTGNQGKVYSVAGKKTSIVVDLQDPKVNCLALDAKGTLYIGTSPKGTVYRVEKGKPASRFAQLDALHIWAMVATTDGLVVGTGDEGKIFHINYSGKVTELFDTDERHITALIKGPDGAFYGGTEPNGLVLKFNLKKYEVFCDTPQGTVGALVFGPDGDLYVGTADISRTGKRSEQEAAKRSIIQKAAQGISRAVSRPRPKSSKIMSRRPSSSSALTGGNYLYRVNGKRIMLPVTPVPGLSIFALASTDMGIIIGTGPKGQLFRLKDDKSEIQLVGKFEEKYIYSLAPLAKGVLVGTSSRGKVYRTLERPAAKGTFTSPVIDAAFPSQWGTIEAIGKSPAGTKVVLATRSGNSKDANNPTWSKWADMKSGFGVKKILSAPSRFLQYRVVLSSDGKGTAEVNLIEAAYLQANVPPTIKSLTVAPLTSTRKGPPGKTKNPGPNTGGFKISWKAIDPNGDSLEYKLLYRDVAESAWKELAKRIKIVSTNWSTVGLPDGYYLFKVEASDGPDNGPEKMFTRSKVSAPFLVDNTPPSVVVKEAKINPDLTVSVKAEISDTFSKIISAVFMVDGKRWTTVFPEDGIYDEKTERVSFKTKALKPGEHTIYLKVRDRKGNVSSGKKVVEITKKKK